MVAADFTNGEERNRGVTSVKIRDLPEPLRLLRAAAIFGPNASGKSTILTAGQALRWIGAVSSRRAEPEGGIPPYEPFKLDPDFSSSPITLGCDVTHKGAILRYELTYTERSIRSETLSQITGSGEDVLVRRRGTKSVTGSLVEMSDSNMLYVRGMQPNVSVLSKLAQHGPRTGADSIMPFYRSIRKALEYEDYTPAAYGLRMDETFHRRFASSESYRNWIMSNLMQKADIGICDVQTEEKPVEFPLRLRTLMEEMSEDGNSFKVSESVTDISFVHKGATNELIDFEDESAGTVKLFNIAGDLWKLSHSSITLFADELGASLHPRLLDQLVRVVNHTARRRSQLIFATHETGLLEGRDGLPPALRRDQVYFTKKTESGSTEMYSLAEFKDEARPVHNIRKRYLSGRYGALPSVEGVSF